MEVLKTDLIKYVTPAHLKVLGIDVCQCCGKALSIDNTTCYNCGFEKDDMVLHELLLNAKNRKLWNDSETIYLARIERNPLYHSKTKLHLVQHGLPMCGAKTNGANKIGILGELNDVLIRRFYSNPCKCCVVRYGNVG